MIFRNLIFEPEVVKQRLRAGMVSHHEQQASKWNGEQQHRVLWPAYNPNIAPPQASTEGLFQQTRLVSTLPIVRSIAKSSTFDSTPLIAQSSGFQGRFRKVWTAELS